MRRSFLITSAAVVTIAAVFVATMGYSQRQTAPKARYVMDVDTATGMAAMGKGMGGAMSMMFGGGGNKEAHMLRLRLGSTLAPNGGTAAADHFPTPAAKWAKSVPLVTPQRAEGDVPEGFERPRGRLLLFWGCGAKAPKGQPVVIDFARVAAGQIPPGLFSSRVPRDPGPTLTNSRTYGEWPNVKNGKQPGKGSSLIGEHRVAGNYAPEIKFTLSQDYMPGLTAQASVLPGGATGLSWNTVAGATGYHAWTFGAKMGADRSAPQEMVWWTSASAKEFGGGLWDWLSPETVRRLIGEKVVMPPSQTTCTVPAEVKAAAPDFMFGNLIAYGPEANYAYPPRPADPKAVWALEWTAKARYRSMTSWMVGGPDMGAAAQGQGEKKCKPSIMGAVLGKAC
jgi:hypothetical protein